MKTLTDFYRLFPSRPVPAVNAARAIAAPVVNVVAPDAPAHNAPRYRARDFGTGYGRSSGYARASSYTEGRGDRMLRVG
ncbi:hypothetical protein [Arenimonas terrae]|jgi:hypothetical protein|uniref:Uncharacterized protein n=1 Tax=Arenimonas terrae TaxID=2546226 RepID=A0A5C4RVV3_9GAMM|nr:hypothetical protein [Arenimonas terrae]TNJ35032.1 hypothetical protein E1B00_04445 [Arenimonas terrae]